MCRCDEPPEKIIRGLTQINYHLDCLDLHARKSNELLIEAQSTINWNIERKRSIASKLEPLIREAGALAEQNQSNFGKDVQPKSTTALQKKAGRT